MIILNPVTYYSYYPYPEISNIMVTWWKYSAAVVGVEVEAVARNSL